MSIRYGVDLVFEPGFTYHVYRSRNAVCAQYACWAAEMHMLRMPIVPYFECPASGEDALNSAINGVAAGARESLSHVLFSRTGVSVRQETGSITLDIDDTGGHLASLHHQALTGVAGIPGAQVPMHSFVSAIYLLEYGRLPPDILEDAAAYAEAALHEAAQQTRAWRLMLLRYSSEAAGDDWRNGRWANDVSWTQLHTYPLA